MISSWLEMIIVPPVSIHDVFVNQPIAWLDSRFVPVVSVSPFSPVCWPGGLVPPATFPSHLHPYQSDLVWRVYFPDVDQSVPDVTPFVPVTKPYRMYHPHLWHDPRPPLRHHPTTFRNVLDIALPSVRSLEQSFSIVLVITSRDVIIAVLPVDSILLYVSWDPTILAIVPWPVSPFYDLTVTQHVPIAVYHISVPPPLIFHLHYSSIHHLLETRVP